MKNRPKVIMSSPIGFAGTTIQFDEIEAPADLTGMTSYCNHPATRVLLEGLGAETVQGKYEGPAQGESFLAAQLRDNPRNGGFTQHQEISGVDQLRFTLCSRIK
jgi:hypothetical protein